MNFKVSSPQNASYISCVVSVAAKGMYPPVIPLDKQSKSGDTSSCSHANIFPVRPKPTATSSNISNMLCSSHSSLILFKYPLGTVIIPPAAITSGSIIKAAISSLCFSIICFTCCVQAKLHVSYERFSAHR